MDRHALITTTKRAIENRKKKTKKYNILTDILSGGSTSSIELVPNFINSVWQTKGMNYGLRQAWLLISDTMI